MKRFYLSIYVITTACSLVAAASEARRKPAAGGHVDCVGDQGVEIQIYPDQKAAQVEYDYSPSGTVKMADVTFYSGSNLTDLSGFVQNISSAKQGDAFLLKAHSVALGAENLLAFYASTPGGSNTHMQAKLLFAHDSQVDYYACSLVQ